MNPIITGLCLFVIPFADGSFIKTPDDVTTCSGTDIVLDWQYTGSPSVVTWDLLPSTRIMSYVSIIGLATAADNYQGRVSYNGNGNITLKGVTGSDSGIYQCNAVFILSAPVDQMEVTVYNRMQEIPEIDYNAKTNHLSCRVPDVTLGVSYTWTFLGKSIGTSNAVVPTQSGEYTCSVSGDAIKLCKTEGVTTSTTSTVSLEKPVVSTDFPIMNMAEGQSATLQCYLKSAVPEIILEWRWYYMENEENVLSNSPLLTIDYVSTAYAGNYSCTARNLVGESEPAGTFLNIFVPPTIAPLENQNPLEDSPLSILCNVTANPKPENNQIVWTKVDKTSFKIIGLELSFNKISREDSGTYTCHVNVSMLLHSGQLISKTTTRDVSINVLYGPGESMMISPDSDVTYYYEHARTNPVMCSAECKPTCRVYWKDPHDNVLDVDTLRLGNATRSMNGTYSCIAENVIASKTFSSEVSIVIIIFYSASIISSIPEGALFIEEGNDIIFECKTDGYPMPYTIWRKNEEIIDKEKSKLLENDEVLLLPSAKRTDSGRYKCEVTNGIGSTKAAVFLLVVQYPPGDSITIKNATGSSESVIVTEGDYLPDLTCSAQCVPECSYTWIHPDGSIVHGSVLSLDKSTRHMNGTYFCYAQNEISSEKHSSHVNVTIIVFYPSEIKSSLQRKTFDVEDGADITLNCSVEGYPKPLISWTKDGINFDVGGNQYLPLQNASCMDSGEYVCIADNNIGLPVSQIFSVSLKCKTTQNGDKLDASVFGNDDGGIVYYAAIGGASGFLIIVISTVTAVIKCKRKRKKPYVTTQDTTLQSVDHVYDTIHDQPGAGVSPYHVGYVRYYPDDSSSRDSRSSNSGNISYSSYLSFEPRQGT